MNGFKKDSPSSGASASDTRRVIATSVRTTGLGRSLAISPSRATNILPTKDYSLGCSDLPNYSSASSKQPVGDTQYDRPLTERFRDMTLSSTSNGSTAYSQQPMSDIQHRASISGLVGNAHLEARTDRDTKARSEMDVLTLSSDLGPTIRRNRELLANERSRGAPLLQRTSPSFAGRLAENAIEMATNMWPYGIEAGTPVDDTDRMPVPNGQIPTGVVFPGEAITTYVNSSYGGSASFMRTSQVAPTTDKARSPDQYSKTENASEAELSGGPIPFTDTTPQPTPSANGVMSTRNELDLSYLERMGLTNAPLWPCVAFSKCAKCSHFFKKFEGFVLRECRQHRLCRACLYAVINNVDNTEIMRCPVSGCSAAIKDIEVDALLHAKVNEAANSSATAVSFEEAGPSAAPPPEAPIENPGYPPESTNRDPAGLIKKTGVCDFCTLSTDKMRGIVLQRCHHMLCKDCLSEKPSQCPVGECQARLTRNEQETFNENYGTPYKKEKFGKEDSDGFQTVSKSKKSKENFASSFLKRF